MKSEQQRRKHPFARWILHASWALAIFAMMASWELQAGSEARLSEGTKRRTLELRNYKRGLFFGSCGPSTYSMQWEYTFTLTGDGPVFKREDITLKDGSLNEVRVSGGSVALDTKHHSINIDLKVTAGAAEISFPQNGRYKLKK